MKSPLPILLLLALFLWNCVPSDTSSQAKTPATFPAEEVQFYTADSILISGDLFRQHTSAASIVLFHQGGSNARAEYGPIIPRLLEKGWNVLAIDQRQGGQYYGQYNRTISRFSDYNYDNAYGYCEAMPDLEAALSFARSSGFSGPLFIWGSSYSAALAIQLAASHPKDLDGVLAFSPATGRPLNDCQPHPFLEQIDKPLLILRPPSEVDGDALQQFVDAGSNAKIEFYQADPGIHGSSMLVEDRVGAKVEAHWKVVIGFIEKVIHEM